MKVERFWKKINRVLLYTTIMACVALLSFPLFWMFLTSVRPESELYKYPPSLVPNEMSMENFRIVASMGDFRVYFLNSIIVAVGVIAITIFVSTLGGYALSRFKYSFKSSLFRFILLSYMIPPILFSLPLFVLLTRMGLTNTLIGLILVELTITVPISLWILVGFFYAIPLELEQSALIDGASRLRAFVQIVLPLSSPGIIAVGLFTFVTSWNDYLYPLIFISSSGKKTLPLGMAFFIHATAVDWGPLMAASCLVTIPTMLLFLFTQRHLISGFGGAVKG